MKPDYVIGFEKGGFSPYAHIQTENMECEVEPEEVDLRSFRVRDRLENRIWNDDGSLDRSVRRALMDISDDFWSFCDIRWVRPETVLLTGSICNYNWSEFSDVDMHVVVDFSKIHDRKDFVQEYFDEKKNDWNNSHDGLTIYGFPVEMYVEDVGADTVSSGVYDLWEDKWVREPEHGTMKPIQLNKYAIKDVSSEIMTEIDDLCDAFAGEDDRHEIEELGKSCDALLKRIKAVRKSGLRRGEMGAGNLVYKVLRHSGYLERLRSLKDDIYDRLNSLSENMRFARMVSKRF